MIPKEMINYGSLLVMCADALKVKGRVGLDWIRLDSFECGPQVSSKHNICTRT